MKETWKDIKCYEGLYQVSNLGRVKSLGRKINTGRNGYRVTTDMILKQHITRGYARVILQKPGKLKSFQVHRLVADAFVPNPDNKPQVNHKNENKLDNCAENLSWVTPKENCNYGTRNDRILKNMQKHHIAKYGQKVLCVELGIIFESISAATKFCGAKNVSYIIACLNHKTPLAFGYRWIRIGAPRVNTGWRRNFKIKQPKL